MFWNPVIFPSCPRYMYISLIFFFYHQLTYYVDGQERMVIKLFWLFHKFTFQQFYNACTIILPQGAGLQGRNKTLAAICRVHSWRCMRADALPLAAAFLAALTVVLLILAMFKQCCENF